MKYNFFLLNKIWSLFVIDYFEINFSPNNHMQSQILWNPHMFLLFLTTPYSKNYFSLKKNVLEVVDWDVCLKLYDFVLLLQLGKTLRKCWVLFRKCNRMRCKTFLCWIYVLLHTVMFMKWQSMICNVMKYGNCRFGLQQWIIRCWFICAVSIVWKILVCHVPYICK